MLNAFSYIQQRSSILRFNQVVSNHFPYFVCLPGGCLISCRAAILAATLFLYFVQAQYITGKGIDFVTLRLFGIIHRLLIVGEKSDVVPIEVQIQMRQIVNDGEPEIIHAIMTDFICSGSCVQQTAFKKTRTATYI